MPQNLAPENWGRDAVFYELHVRAFHDANGDGVGDFEGLIQKLDYLAGLGITALWLLPFYPSPLRDDGYDIADFFGIHPDYGTMRDFRRFLREAHARGLRVLTELVLNHTSIIHPWFQRARSSSPQSAFRKFYVWSDTPERYRDTRIIFRDFENSNWAWDPVAKAYYWHRFYSHQADLNFDHPPVRRALLRVIDFWFGLGVDGLRLDAVPYLFEREGTSCENLPETHAFLRELRRHVDNHHPGRILLAEANQWPEEAAAYFGAGDECHMAFHFPLMPRLFLSLQTEDAFPIMDILASTPSIPADCRWAIFLRNHDELTLEMVTDEEMETLLRAYAHDPRTKINVGIRRRLAPLLGNDRRKMELMNILLLSLPGTPILYYGDEIGMGDNYFLGDRGGVRTPMQWSPDRNAGFSCANPLQLYLPVVIDPEYHYQTVNVETQERNISSLLWWTRRGIAMRKRFRCLAAGDFEILAGDNMKVFAFARRLDEEIIVVVVNLSGSAQLTGLDLNAWAGRVPEEIFGQSHLPVITMQPYRMLLGSYGYYCLVLHKPPEPSMAADRLASQYALEGSWRDLIEGGARDLMESEILPRYLRRSAWFWSKDRSIRSVSVADSIPLGRTPNEFLLVLVLVNYAEGFPDFYSVPLAFVASGPHPEDSEVPPECLIARLATRDGEGLLLDAAFLEEFQQTLLDFIGSRRTKKGSQGFLVALPGPGSADIANRQHRLPSRIIPAAQSNTLAVYGTDFILKLYRRLDEGLNPELEISRLLRRSDSVRVPDWLGALEYRRLAAGPLTVAVLHRYIHPAESAWDFAAGHVRRFLESVLQNSTVPPPAPAAAPLLDVAPLTPGEMDLVGKMFLDKISLLGLRTAQLHEAMSELPGPEFSPEPMTGLYRRALLQSMQSMTRRTLGRLRQACPNMPEPAARAASSLLDREGAILEALRVLTTSATAGQKIRVHGDFHLHQALFTGQDFFLIDFEGEPERPLAERRIKASPLKDVAGMIRSFHYVIHAVLWMQELFRPQDQARLQPWVRPWLRIITRAYLDAYFNYFTDSVLIPSEPRQKHTLLRAFLLEKAVYELGYELRHRPDWVLVPILGIGHVLSTIPPEQSTNGPGPEAP